MTLSRQLIQEKYKNKINHALKAWFLIISTPLICLYTNFNKFDIILPLTRINEKITAPELRVIDETGANLGILSSQEALKLAKEKGQDLIEIAPTAQPPVVKIMSFDKYRYQEEKKLKKQKAQQKSQELKQVRISARAAKHDLEIKAKKVNEFLEEGHLVQIQLTLRGREKANKGWAREKMDEFLKIIIPEHKIIMEPRFAGRGLTVQIAKKTI